MISICRKKTKINSNIFNTYQSINALKLVQIFEKCLLCRKWQVVIVVGYFKLLQIIFLNIEFWQSVNLKYLYKNNINIIINMHNYYIYIYTTTLLLISILMVLLKIK